MKSMISHTQRVQKIVFFKLTSRYSKGCEGAVASSESLRPTLSSVLYLGDVGGPTMILNQVGRLKGGRTWDIAVLVGLSDSGACGWRLVCSSTTEATLLREPAWVWNCQVASSQAKLFPPMPDRGWTVATRRRLGSN